MQHYLLGPCLRIQISLQDLKEVCRKIWWWGHDAEPYGAFKENRLYVRFCDGDASRDPSRLKAYIQRDIEVEPGIPQGLEWFPLHQLWENIETKAA